MATLRWIILTLIFISTGSLNGQSKHYRMLLLDKTMASPILLSAYASPWLTAGCDVQYRRYHPYLVYSDTTEYDILMILGGTTPLAPGARITREDVDIMKIFYAKGKGIILAFENALNGAGSDDRHAMNQFLRELRLNIEISEMHARQDSLPYRSLMGQFGRVRRYEQWIYSKTDTIAFGEIVPLRILRGANLELVAESFPAASFKKGKITYPGPFQLSVITGNSAPILIIPRKAFHVFGPTRERNASPFFDQHLRRNTREFLNNLALRFTKILQRKDMLLSPVIASSALESRSDSQLPRWQALPQVPVADFLPVETIDLASVNSAQESKLIQSEKYFADRVTSPVMQRYLREGIKAVWGRLTPLRSESREVAPAKRLEELDLLTYFFQESGCNLFWAIAAPQAFAGDGLYTQAEIEKIKALWLELGDQFSAAKRIWFAGLDYRDFRQPAGRTRNFQNSNEPVWSPLNRQFWRQGFWQPLSNIAHDAAKFSALQGFVIDTDFYGLTKSNAYNNAHEFSTETVAFFRQSARGFAPDSLLQDFMETPADQRFAFLLDNALLPLYYHILMQESERFARRLRERVEHFAPKFCWGIFLPHLPTDWYEIGLLRGLSHPGKPVLLFTYEPFSRQAMLHLREQQIYALPALAISSVQINANEWGNFYRSIRQEKQGFWISSAESLLLPEGVRLRDKTLSREEFAALIAKISTQH